MKKVIVEDNGRVRVVREFDSLSRPSRVQKHFKDDTDINKIIKKYHAEQRLLQAPNKGYYGDFSNAPTYLEARQSLINAQVAFNNLPSDVRKRFDNDPHQLLSFLDDSNNRDEAIKLGLIDPPPPPPSNIPNIPNNANPPPKNDDSTTKT